MPCLIGCLALSFPRIALVLVWLFGNPYLQNAYQSWLWPVLGFFFMPLTTLAYGWAWHQGSGSVAGVGLVVVIVAALIDLGMLGGGARHKNVREYYAARK